ncbi:MAG TPA: acyl-CoA dehydrogenase family protein [Burkholderiales bacterium]|nr:acyl-CoA dehydrogenase family protein [Burkholderiales bacterium]
MNRFAHYDWPFLEERHAALAREAGAWAQANLGPAHGEDADAICRGLVEALGAAGYLRYCAPGTDHFDVRAIALLREVFAYHSGLADFAFVMQGLGSGPIALAGSAAQRERYLTRVGAGRAIAAFALSEPDAGSDVAALSTTARRDGAHWVLDGAKAWISNGGLADFYVVFARTDAAAGSRGISAFVVDADAPGLDARERIDIVAPHPMASLRFNGCRVPADALLGEPGEGFKLAMRNLDVFRTTVGAAALGLARRALDEALRRAKGRRMFGQTLADFQLTQAKLADMATGIDAAALLVYRAAWARDVHARRITSEAAMAKMYATETAQQVVDAAVQICGGLGVMRGHPVELLYREVRALRIYEGATEVQKLIVARELLK